jgi:hypothetical protein
MASAVPVTLKDNSDPGACWIESLEDGWLFLIPNSALSGWLLAVGEAPEVLLGQSRVVAAEIAIAAPLGRVSGLRADCSPLCAPVGWPAEPAAMAFDPICGDGTAHAIREAILASAVIRALANGGSAGDLLRTMKRV